jgi:hypothetical protein
MNLFYSYMIFFKSLDLGGYFSHFYSYMKNYFFIVRREFGYGL